MIEQANPLDPSNAEVDNVANQFFEMGLETNAIIESLATLTLYNWQLANATDSFEFATASNMWNSIKYIDDNGKFSTLHYHFI